MRSEKDSELISEIREDISLGQLAEDGAQLRPHIVWFEEPVPMMEQAIAIVEQADIFAVIGTSLVVYPAAGLVNYTPPFIPKFVVDKKIPDMQPMRHLTKIEAPATTGIHQLKDVLLQLI